MTRTCPTCGNERAEIEFVRLIESPSGQQVTLPTENCIRCISAAQEGLRKGKRRNG